MIPTSSMPRSCWCPLTGFLEPDDPRIRRTVEAIEKHLMKGRFRAALRGPTMTTGSRARKARFIACSFWFVDNLVLIGRRDDARAMFERLIGIATDLGFIAEEYDTVNKRQIGNFPQAFSHIALINSAFNLGGGNETAPAKERSGQDG